MTHTYVERSRNRYAQMLCKLRPCKVKAAHLHLAVVKSKRERSRFVRFKTVFVVHFDLLT